MVDFTGGTWRSLIDGSEVSAIPDASIWDSEQSSEDFWLEFSQIKGLPSDIMGDDNETYSINSGGTDELMAIRDDWDDLGGLSDINDVINHENTNISFFVKNGRYICQWEHEGDDANNIRGMVNVLGVFNLSSADTLHYQLSLDDDGVGSPGTAICLSEVGSGESFDIVDTLTSTGTVEDTFDISTIENDREVILIANARTGANPTSEWADIYFS